MPQPLLRYASYVTGKRVIVNVDLTESSNFDYTFDSPGSLTEQEYLLLESEVREKANAAIQSKILLG